MKKYVFKTLIYSPAILIPLLFTTHLNSQNVAFDYDECGNRISQEIIYLKNLAVENDYADIENKPVESTAIIGNVQLTIFPNPNGGQFTVHLKNLKPENDTRLQLHDMNGELILNKKHLASKNPVNIDQYKNGAYLLSITIDGIRKTWKVIKQ